MMQDAGMPLGERIKNWLTNNDFRKYTGLDEKQVEDYELILPKEYQCPSDILFKKGQVSRYKTLVGYGYNISDWNGGPAEQDITCYWDSEDGGGVPQCDPQPWLIGHKRTAIPRASEKINFTEGNDWWASWENGANYVQGWDELGQAPPFHDDLPNYGDGSDMYGGMWGATLYRHNEGCNLAFYDGHVECLPKEKVFIDTDGNLENNDTGDATGMWFVLPP
jgi:prepilin-type processing-associated H-X9-DG protein